MFEYKPNGVCAQSILLDVSSDAIIRSVKFVRGCPGNLIGVAKLVEGRTVDDVIEMLGGITCGSRTTSCPDQLSLALKAYKQAQ